MNRRNQKTPQPVVDLTADLTGRVLVVDDDYRGRKLLHDLLTYYGHEVLEAGDGHTAIDLAFRHRPDVILLDVLMPDMNGFDVCAAIRANAEMSATPVLFITALADREHRLKAIEHGANDYLTKPIDTRDVALRVRNAIRLKRLVDELQRVNQNLQELEQLRDRLIRWIVHDMKAPMGAIAGYMELLIMEAADKLTPEQMGYIQDSLQAARRLIHMANTLLDIGRLEENRIPMNIVSVEVRGICEEVARELRSIAAEGDVKVELPEHQAWVKGDADILRRVITNLLDNALKVTTRGGSVRFSIAPHDGMIEVSVIDQGPGIPPELHSRLFEKFGMVGIETGLRKTYSTGLGLHFSKLALEAMGGQIGVESEVGKGSRFWIRLPKGEPTEGV